MIARVTRVPSEPWSLQSSSYIPTKSIGGTVGDEYASGIQESGKWHASSMTAGRIAKLDNLGFDWGTRNIVPC